MSLLKSESDFKWHKRGLDFRQKCEHEHVGVPESYPCKVDSERKDYRNEPVTYYHTFVYQRIRKCPRCGGDVKTWEAE